MSPQIDLDILVGPDVEVLIGEDAFWLPADIPAPKMLRLMRLYENTDKEGSVEDMEAIVEEMLSIFQIRQPELEELPVGFAGILVLLEQLMNLYTDEPAAEEEAGPARPTRAASRPSSNGSSRSKKPSAGARKTGARSAGGN